MHWYTQFYSPDATHLLI